MRRLITTFIIGLGFVTAVTALAREIEDGKLLVYPQKDGKYKAGDVIGDKVTFYGYAGDVWERKGLSKRDRSLITCAALIALNRSEQQVGHFQRALNNGVTKEELLEVITHLAFYGGWPVAMSAAQVAKKVFEGGDNK